MLIKGFDKELKCRGFQFEVGQVYEVEGAPELCSNGFHYCDNVADVHTFYDLRKERENRFCEVEALGEVDKGDNKLCTNKIKIVREIVGIELEKLINIGSNNWGIWNTGNSNTGNCNTGNWNTGNRNTGDSNTGNRNTGDCNTGNWNTGNSNTGIWNTGNSNTGGFNSCDFSNGFFCTEEPTINIFNMPTNFTASEFYQSDYYGAVTNGNFRLTEWIEYSEEEKAIDEMKKNIGRYLKKYTHKEACANWWNSLDDKDREIIKGIPNFNANIFKEITGIDV
jgi:hypothetical protein